MSTTDPLTIALAAGSFTLAAALVGQILSGCITNANNKKTEKRAFDQRRKAMTLQIYAEINAALLIVEERQYLDAMDAAIQHLTVTGGKLDFQVHVADDSFPIFKSNAGNLGVMPAQLLTPVITFYTLVLSVIQDIRPGGLLAEGAEKEAFEQCLDISRKAVEIGRSIVHQIEVIYPELKSQLPKGK